MPDFFAHILYITSELLKIPRQKKWEDSHFGQHTAGKFDRQVSALTDRCNSSVVCLHNHCAVTKKRKKKSFDVISLDRPIPRHHTLSHRRHRKHIKSTCIIHIHQSHYLNISSKQAFLSVCLWDLAVEKLGKANRERLSACSHLDSL